MDKLTGMVERITFRNEENLYTIMRLRCREHRELVTAVGSFPHVAVGESLAMSGEWVMHPQYGRQFKVTEHETLLPTTITGLERYLGSGLIKGVGPSTAKSIVKRFGLKSMEVLDEQPERLTEIPGIGPAKATSIAKAFAEQKEIRDMMIYLQGYGITPGYATRIFRHYGNEARAVIEENPYRLADDVFGIGFKTADKLAQAMGLAPEAEARLVAGIKFTLGQLAEEGHTCYPLEPFFGRAADMLEVPAELLPAAVETLRAQKEVFLVQAAEQEFIYLAPFFYAESGVANRLSDLTRREVQLRLTDNLVNALDDFDAAISDLEATQRLRLAPEQRQAVRAALEQGVLVITGGPGTGKTTIVRTLLRLLEKQNQRVLLAAPTGRAAKRLTETTGVEAKTIHRLLEYTFVEGQGMGFGRNDDTPLEADVVILDEASMVDILLMYHFLKAIPQGCRLVLVGDVDQLPSVGAGNVLRDIIESEQIATVRLKTIFRQAGQSLIVQNAHRINQGDFPFLNSRDNDFFFLPEEDPEKLVQLVIDLCRTRLPQSFSFHPLEDIQVLSPMRRSLIGVENLNEKLQEALNPPSPSKPEVRQGFNLFRVGDKVMQIKNNYQKQVFNGDIGRIASIDKEEGEIRVVFPEGRSDRIVVYELLEADELTLAYATSVHKSQGSEYPAVVMPVSTQHYIMLQRNLLYTGITRAKKLVVLVGTKKALAMAIRNNEVKERHSLLGWRLQGASH